MKEFDYEKLAERTWDKEVLNYIGLIHEYKGTTIIIETKT